MQKKRKERNSSLKKYIVADRYDGMVLEEYVKTIMGVSARQRQKLFFSKGVYVNGNAAHTKRPLKAGDMVAVRQFKDSSYGVMPQEGKLEVLYEDEAMIVLNKPAGMLVHPAGKTQDGTLANYLANYFKERGKMVTIRAIHRLDRDTTGCVLFAKSGAVQTKLEKALKDGKLHRSYKALVCGNMEELQAKYPDGEISLPIGKTPLQSNRRMVTETGQTAITHFSILQQGERYSLLELQLETGRTHQIRVHLAYVGCPVLGDRMYGSKSSFISRQALHAAALELFHPISGEKISIAAPEPEDFKNIIKEL